MLPNFTRIRQLIQETNLLVDEDKFVLNKNLVLLKKIELLSLEKGLQMQSEILLKQIFKSIAAKEIAQNITQNNLENKNIQMHVKSSGNLVQNSNQNLGQNLNNNFQKTPQKPHLYSQNLENGEQNIGQNLQQFPIKNEIFREQNLSAENLLNLPNNTNNLEVVLGKNALQNPEKNEKKEELKNTQNLTVNSHPKMPLVERNLQNNELIQIQNKNINVGAKSGVENVEYMGGEVLSLVNFDEFQNLREPQNLEEINDFRQLIKINDNVLDFGQNESGERIIYNFVKNISNSIPKEQSIHLKRSILLAFIRSGLFYKYISTGLAGLNYKYNRDPEILNKMGQVSSDYLNANKFKYASLLTAELRNFASV